MPDWLNTADVSEGTWPWTTLLTRLLAALLLGGGVAMIYRLSHGREQRSPGTLFTTLILLSVLIAMVSMTIGNSVARAFSLVGALSIVRFRTVVDDTRDTAFVIFAVIVGMAAGAGMLLLPLIGLPVVGLAAIGLSQASPRCGLSASQRCKLTVRLALGRDADAVLGPALLGYFEEASLIDVSTARQGAALDLTYVGLLRSPASMAPLVAELNRIEGVMEVELSRTET